MYSNNYSRTRNDYIYLKTSTLEKEIGVFIHVVMKNLMHLDKIQTIPYRIIGISIYLSTTYTN